MSAFPAFQPFDISGIAVVQVLLLALAVLLWRVLKWLKLIADGLGCNPHRTEQIKKLMKQLGYDPYREDPFSRLSKVERQKLDEDLDELFEAELFDSPAKGGQSIRLIERLDAITKLLEARLQAPTR